MKDGEVQLVRPPVAVGHGAGGGVAAWAGLGSHHGAFAEVFHGFVWGVGLAWFVLSCGWHDGCQQQSNEHGPEVG